VVVGSFLTWQVLAARCPKVAGAEKVFSEQVSSTAQRAKLGECLAFLRVGDVLTVTKPDRLARSTMLIGRRGDLGAGDHAGTPA
jgi:DNA invertase Pin-like site-specific DNA recombinase